MRLAPFSNCDMLAAIVENFGAGVKRGLIFVHRWMGVALCLLFLLWFASGIGMMYWEYPLIMPEDRLAAHGGTGRGEDSYFAGRSVRAIGRGYAASGCGAAEHVQMDARHINSALAQTS